MSTKTPGIQLVPVPPDSVVSGATYSRDLSEILTFRNKLVETRNAQLEHKQTAAQLYDKIRLACRDLSRRDYSVKEGMEVLNLERQRLGFLRDELARRAEMISRWEAKVRESEHKLTNKSQPHIKRSVNEKEKEFDRMNALLLEMEQQKRSNIGFSIGSERSLAVVTPESRKSVKGILIQQQLPSVTLDKKQSPQSQAIEESDLSGDVSSFVPEAVVLTAAEAEPAPVPPRPYPTWTQEGAAEDAFVEEMRECLDFFWKEYSTQIGGEDDRLMTLPNLMRLCADANLGAPTQTIIEIYLRAAKMGKESLVERRFFLTLLQSVLAVSTGGNLSSDSVELTDLLFSQYLMPLMVRLTIQQRLVSKQHPSLERKPLTLPHMSSTNN
jgi:hypothetical protein